MGYVRAILRLLFAVLWTLFLLAVRLAAVPIRVAAPSLEWAIRRAVFRFWARGLCVAVGMRVEVEGPRPREPFLLVSNHITFFDVLLLSGELGCLFVAKSEVRRWPVLGFITWCMNTIFVDRTRPRDAVRVNALIARALERGHGVHLFAEGGIVSPGEPAPFKPALLEPAVRAGLAVHYATVSYRAPEGRPGAAGVIMWRQGLGFPRHVFEVLQLPKFYAIVTFGKEPIRSSDRKVLAHKLWEAVRAQYTPVQ